MKHPPLRILAAACVWGLPPPPDVPHVAEGAGHLVHVDDPGLVVSEIRRLASAR